MKKQTAAQIIERELYQLDVPKNSLAYSLIYENALEFSEIADRNELILYINEYCDTLPNYLFLAEG